MRLLLKSIELTELPRPQVSPTEPVVYSFDYTPEGLEDWQVIEFSVESWSAADGTTGPQSQMVAGGAGEASWAAALYLQFGGLEIPAGAACDSVGNLCVAFELSYGG